MMEVMSIDLDTKIHRAAAIDVGSNAIRILIGENLGNKQYNFIYRQRVPVRLGHDAFTSGVLSKETIARCLAAFESFHEILKKKCVTSVAAVGTSALRDAKNSKTLINLIYKKTGIHLNIISGLHEATLVNKAICWKEDLKNRNALLVDIGGGSLEVSHLKHLDTITSETVPLGTVRMLEKFGDQPIHFLERNKHISNELWKIESVFESFLKSPDEEKILLGTGGNFEFLGDLRVRLFNKRRNTVIRKEELERILRRLGDMSVEERISNFGMRVDRADVIIPASLVIKGIFDITHASKIIVPRVGLREGLFFYLSEQKSVRKKK